MGWHVVTRVARQSPLVSELSDSVHSLLKQTKTLRARLSETQAEAAQLKRELASARRSALVNAQGSLSLRSPSTVYSTMCMCAGIADARGDSAEAAAASDAPSLSGCAGPWPVT